LDVALAEPLLGLAEEGGGIPDRRGLRRHALRLEPGARELEDAGAIGDVLQEAFADLGVGDPLRLGQQERMSLRERCPGALVIARGLERLDVHPAEIGLYYPGKRRVNLLEPSHGIFGQGSRLACSTLLDTEIGEGCKENGRRPWKPGDHLGGAVERSLSAIKF